MRVPQVPAEDENLRPVIITPADMVENSPSPFSNLVSPPLSDTDSVVTDSSLRSSMNTRAFREDEGRLYQATDDERETQSQGNKNYLAPIPAYLPNAGKDKSVLDVGTGSGAWPCEIAQEFPNAEVIGVDLAPTWNDNDLPDNVEFQQGDITAGLPFPDGRFDVVHGRTLVAGIRDWPQYINEMIRLVKPGGLFISHETSFPWVLQDQPDVDHWSIAPGFMAISECVARALVVRGHVLSDVTESLPRLISEHPYMEAVERVALFQPFWGWSNDPWQKQSGDIMLRNARDIPDVGDDVSQSDRADIEALRLLIIDGCGIAPRDYEDLKFAFLADLEKPGANSGVPQSVVWGRKKGGPSPTV
ncbi:hypothetical protein TREMEDRAFT_63811 [Tremella mesenterica DSM 1558]|uniref:uncharacterized protein n=1 Tax=Tremella mesenterica (strain ATCC 24925 / CBS 8224 / DSM 1558 / NBRC 9311 / NRRL Y-6157 / RJB 2259-6 / UBC 559-6) TaxID=578456 RepID=UPI0003F49327|nr:uncharacterized protein TREMEDRAFT_63811 [Tremella mesenterica DSM 1558]EIW67923.1 hypothetical protein TREMEDRAFT_63811 [Tremella mesenterica DSM 1558]